jgi:hypothetical protein
MALRGGAINLRATATAGPKHVTTKSAEIMEEAMVSLIPAASARLLSGCPMRSVLCCQCMLSMRCLRP